MNIEKINSMIVDLCNKDIRFLKKSEIIKNNKKIEKLKHIRLICEYYRSKEYYVENLENIIKKINSVNSNIANINNKTLNENLKKSLIKEYVKEVNLKKLENQEKDLNFIINNLF